MDSDYYYCQECEHGKLFDCGECESLESAVYEKLQIEEIRVKKGRYGGGYIGIAIISEIDNVNIYWDNLSDGDMEYFDARAFFKATNNAGFVEHAKSFEDAYKIAIERAVVIKGVSK